MMPTVLVTRPQAQASDLGRLLEERGVAPVCVPTVEIDHASTSSELDTMLAGLDGAAWLVITSANGARAVLDRMAANGADLPATLRIAAVGPVTAEFLRAGGIQVDHVPDDHLTAQIADGLGDVAERRVVLAQGDASEPALAEALRQRGAVVDEVVAYRIHEGPASSRDSLQAALHRGLDGLAFTSGSTVRGLLRLISPLDRARARTVPAFCIGPPTAETARRLGFDVAAVATPHTGIGLADAISSHLRRGRR